MLGALSLMRYARLHENLVAASKLLRDFFALKPTVKPVVVAVIACIRFFHKKTLFSHHVCCFFD